MNYFNDRIFLFSNLLISSSILLNPHISLFESYAIECHLYLESTYKLHEQVDFRLCGLYWNQIFLICKMLFYTSMHSPLSTCIFTSTSRFRLCGLFWWHIFFSNAYLTNPPILLFEDYAIEYHFHPKSTYNLHKKVD